MNGRKWTKTADKLMKCLYPDMRSIDVARILKRTLLSTYNRAKTLGLSKSEFFKMSEMSGHHNLLSEAGKKYRFTKGHNPANAGKTGYKPWMRGLFEKGAKPKNTLYDGHISIRTSHTSRLGSDGLPKSYKWIRINGKWLQYHQYLWIQKNGPIPAKHIVIFKDKDQMNCALDNLELVSLKENLRRNNETNRWKAHMSTREKHELGEDPTGVKTLQDSYVAGLISGDKEMKKEILQNYPEMVIAKRTQLTLNRIIKDERKANRKA